MINSVSFAAKHGIYDKANVDAPQAHQRPQEPMANHPRYEEPKKKHSVLKTLGAIASAAILAVGGLAIASKMGKVNPETIKKAIPEKLLNWERVASWKEPVKKGIEAVNNFGNKAGDVFLEIHKNTFQKIADFITGKGKVVEEVAEEVVEGVGKV